MRDRFALRLLLLGVAVFIAVALWRSWPNVAPLLRGGSDATPRAVVARGDLAADEKSTIELFERSRASVVFISTRQQVQDFWTRNVFSVPRGTGSGFIWDDAGTWSPTSTSSRARARQLCGSPTAATTGRASSA